MRSRADSISMCVAGACAIHCVATPLVIGIFPLVGMTMADSRLEIAFLVASITVSGTTLSMGCLRHHRRWGALVPFAVGAVILLFRRLGGVAESGLIDVTSVLIGAALVVTAHVKNIQLCRRAGASGCGRFGATASEGCGPMTGDAV